MGVRKYEGAVKAAQAHIVLFFSTRSSGPACRALPEADNPPSLHEVLMQSGRNCLKSPQEKAVLGNNLQVTSQESNIRREKKKLGRAQGWIFACHIFFLV